MKKCDGNHSVADNHECNDIECWDDTNRAFNRWWHEEGSGMPPRRGEDAYEHVQRLTRIAWSNGAYRAVEDIVEKEKEPEASSLSTGCAEQQDRIEKLEAEHLETANDLFDANRKIEELEATLDRAAIYGFIEGRGEGDNTTIVEAKAWLRDEKKEGSFKAAMKGDQERMT